MPQISDKNKTKKKKNSLHIPSIRSLSRRACPPGMVERRSYVRKFSTAIRQKGYTVKRASGASYRVYPKTTAASVKSVCVKDTHTGNSKPHGSRRKGELYKYGYSYRESIEKRKTALRHAIKVYGAKGVFRKLKKTTEIAQRLLPSAASIYKNDSDWVKDNFLKTA